MEELKQRHFDEIMSTFAKEPYFEHYLYKDKSRILRKKWETVSWYNGPVTNPVRQRKGGIGLEYTIHMDNNLVHEMKTIEYDHDKKHGFFHLLGVKDENRENVYYDLHFSAFGLSNEDYDMLKA